MNIHFSSMTDHWSTPKSVYDELNKEFHFDYDPCPLNSEEDGLNQTWIGTSIFVNPPYSNIKEWLKHGYGEHSCDNKTVVFLIPSRTDTKWWHEYVMKADEIRFIKGRLKFGNAKNSAPFPSCVVIFKSSEQKAEG